MRRNSAKASQTSHGAFSRFGLGSWGTSKPKKKATAKRRPSAYRLSKAKSKTSKSGTKKKTVKKAPKRTVKRVASKKSVTKRRKTTKK